MKKKIAGFEDHFWMSLGLQLSIVGWICSSDGLCWSNRQMMTKWPFSAIMPDQGGARRSVA